MTKHVTRTMSFGQTLTHMGVERREMKPTMKHRPALWECMLGTVYAMNADREIEYFDYDWERAIEFAGLTQEGADVRKYRNKPPVHSWGKNGERGPSPNQMVWWVRK